MKPDRVTKRWILNAADEHAAEHLGMRFDERRVDHLYQCLMDHVVLWEGEKAGEFWSPLGWHHETLAPIFGWVYYNEHYGRELRRFRIASIWIGKKNGKSPTGAVVGLYLMRFDGEPGMQVFSAARDGKQAMIVHGNAMNMVRSSPSLSRELRINKSSGRIVWEEGHSVYAPMSADNMLSQEGKNGSVIIDEVHTVDERLGRILADMGASRPEPMIFEISTGGEGVDNYGRHRWEYGMQVEGGTVIDPHFFFKAYAPPQNTPDEELCQFDADGKPTELTLNHWKSANPSLGEILDPVEFQAACIRAKQSDADWAGFKARRLNIWQRTATPWLGGSVWAKSEDSLVSEEMLSECGGGMGIDLARVNDMTACAFVCPSPIEVGQWHLIVKYWIPESRLKRVGLKNVSEFFSWEREGWIKSTPGAVTDYRVISEDILQLVSDIGCQVVCYDRLFAHELVATVADETGILAVEFPQNHNSYSTPSLDFKRMLMSGQLLHNENPVLAWQAGHCLIREIGNGRIKPIKEKGHSHKTIDGVQAAVMALKACQLAEDYGSMEDDVTVI